MRSFASYLCLLGLFSLCFVVESANGHGIKVSSNTLVSESFYGCTYGCTETTVYIEYWKARYRYDYSNSSRDDRFGPNRGPYFHDHTWTEYSYYDKGHSKYSDSCDCNKPECEWVEKERKIGWCYDDNKPDSKECRANYEPQSDKTKKEGNIVYYYETYEEWVCE